MGVFVVALLLCVLTQNAVAQTIGKTKTEDFKADFEKKRDISAYMDYDGPQIPIQILKCGIYDEMYEMYPELKEKFDKYLQNKEDDDTLNMIKEEIKLMCYNKKSMINNASLTS